MRLLIAHYLSYFKSEDQTTWQRLACSTIHTTDFILHIKFHLLQKLKYTIVCLHISYDVIYTRFSFFFFVEYLCGSINFPNLICQPTKEPIKKIDRTLAYNRRALTLDAIHSVFTMYKL